MSDVNHELYDEDLLFDSVSDGFVSVHDSMAGIERDRWDRPLIKPDPAWRRTDYPLTDHSDSDVLALRRARSRALEACGGWLDGRVSKGQLATGERPYSRVSTVAQYIDPMHGLGIWKQRHIALAVARRPDLQALLCGLTYQDKKAVDACIEEALLRARDDDTDVDHKLTAAPRGTAFHTFTTPGAVEADPTFGPSIAAYRVAADKLAEELERAKLEIISSERFVVNDQLQLGGTYDHLVLDHSTGYVHVLDKKTGSHQWTVHAAQLDGYARSQHYDPVTGERTPLHPELDTSTGFIASTDLATGRCIIHPVDLSTRLMDVARASHRANSSDAVKAIVGKPL